MFIHLPLRVKRCTSIVDNSMQRRRQCRVRERQARSSLSISSLKLRPRLGGTRKLRRSPSGHAIAVRVIAARRPHRSALTRFCSLRSVGLELGQNLPDQRAFKTPRRHLVSHEDRQRGRRCEFSPEFRRGLPAPQDRWHRRRHAKPFGHSRHNVRQSRRARNRSPPAEPAA